MGRLDDVKEPLMSDREALDIISDYRCDYRAYLPSNRRLNEAIKVAIRALEDRILHEDDGR